MGVFDIFKKKTTDSTFPENDLEVCLMKASTDASARKEFYMKLLWSPLIIISADQADKEKKAYMSRPGDVLKLVSLPDGRIPVFSASNRIYDKGVMGNKLVQILTINAQDLFSTTKGATFILNPYSAYGKELIPQEIEALLSGTIFEHGTEIKVETPTQILMAQPANYPHKLTEALSQFFIEKTEVDAAYLALVKWPDKEKPHLLIGIDAEGSITPITNQAGPIAERFLEKGELLDFVKIEGNNGPSDYLKTTKPFYSRQ